MGGFGGTWRRAVDWPALPFAQPGWRRRVALLLGLGAVAMDLTVFRDMALAHGWERPAMGVAVLAMFVALGGGASEVGLRRRPLPSGRYWWRVGLLYASVCALLASVPVAFALLRGEILWDPAPPSGDVGWFVFSACVAAPVNEELIYRVALCAPLATCIGPWATVIVSAALFGYAHVRWDSFHASHLIGGAIEAWVYLRSSCVWMPMLFHAINNGVAVAAYLVIVYAR